MVTLVEMQNLQDGKFHNMADLLYILFGLSCFAYVELASALLV